MKKRRRPAVDATPLSADRQLRTEHRRSQAASSPDSDLRLIRRIFRETRDYRHHLIGLLVLSAIGIPLALLEPVPLAIAVDSVLEGRPPPSFLRPILPDVVLSSPVRLLAVAAILLVAIVLLIQLQRLLSAALETFVGEEVTLRFRARLLNHAQRLSFAFHDERGTADSIYRIQYDASAMQYVAVQSFIPLVKAVLMLAAMLWVIFQLSSSLAALSLAITPFLFAISHAYRRKMRPEYRESKRLESRALHVVQEVLTSFRVVKAFGREEHEEERFRRHSARSVRKRIRLAIAENAFGLVVTLTTTIGTALVLFVGVRQVQAGELTVGSLLVVLSYLASFYGPVTTVSRKVASLQNHLASAQRAFELLDEKPDVTEHPLARRIDRARGHVEFHGVGFAYDDGQPVLRDVWLDVPSGTRVGIAGRTGAGKTTLVSLLSRFYDPTTGAITLDGVDIREYRIADLREQFSIVLQETVLFSTSIADNIAYARPDASASDIELAARAAGAHEFVVAMPEGYDTIVGERGMRLSGGERQRIGLARAFLKDAPLLILDEPTSAVDVDTEAAIMDAMTRLMEGRTTFMIAHRLSTLEHCDVVYRVEGGRVSSASHQERSAMQAVMDRLRRG